VLAGSAYCCHPFSLFSFVFCVVCFYGAQLSVTTEVLFFFFFFCHLKPSPLWDRSLAETQVICPMWLLVFLSDVSLNFVFFCFVLLLHCLQAYDSLSPLTAQAAVDVCYMAFLDVVVVVVILL
jgi:hypothetical protein